MPSGIVIGLMLIWLIARGAWHNVVVLLALLVYVATIGADNQNFSFLIVAVVSAIMIATQAFGPRAGDDTPTDDDSGERRDD